MLYKKQIQVERICYGGQGVSDEITPLTEWLDEEVGLRALGAFKEIADKEKWFCGVQASKRYVPDLGSATGEDLIDACKTYLKK